MNLARWVCQAAWYSMSIAPTKRSHEASFGKIPTTRVLRFISRIKRSSMLVE